MDFIEGLAKSQGKSVILVVVDRLTKFAHFFALSHPFTAHTVAKVFLDNVYKLHGLPLSLVTDRDKVFTSVFWKELFKGMGTSLDFTTAYHPQSDGQTERVNQCLETYLRCMVHQNPRLWINWLSLAEFWYNTNHHTSLKMTPFEALYGYPPPHSSLLVNYPVQEMDAKQVITTRQQIMQELKENLTAAQARMKNYADKRRVERTFEIGDWVYLKLQPFRQNSVALRRNMKLAARYYGPYKILEKIGQVAYRLQLPDDSRVHPVFHVSLLKKVLSPRFNPAPILPVLDQDGAFVVTPISILDKRVILRQGGQILQYLVLWDEQDSSFTSWEDSGFLRRKFPHFNPWGQGSHSAAGIVVNLDSDMGIDKKMKKKLGREEEDDEKGILFYALVTELPIAKESPSYLFDE